MTSKPWVAEANRRRIKHGATVGKREGADMRPYMQWIQVKHRCLNPKAQHYHRYGGRGITMCPTWVDDYTQFRADVGEAPTPHATIERIDNDGNYEPGNVRWATRKEQANNRSTNINVEWQGETRTLKQWAEHLGWKYGMLTGRWKLGWRGDYLFAPPIIERNKGVAFRGVTLPLHEWASLTGIKYQTLYARNRDGRPLLTDKEAVALRDKMRGNSHVPR